MFDCNSGMLVGHTVSTQPEVAGATKAEKEQWELEFLSGSSNYAECNLINQHLIAKLSADDTYRMLRIFVLATGDQTSLRLRLPCQPCSLPVCTRQSSTVTDSVLKMSISAMSVVELIVTRSF